MKLSTIICMKQWDKQGQEGSRCKLSRNLCPSVTSVGAVVGSSGVGSLPPGSAGALLTPSHPKFEGCHWKQTRANGPGWL